MSPDPPDDDDVLPPNDATSTSVTPGSRVPKIVFGVFFLALSIPCFVSWWWIHTETRVNEEKRTKKEIKEIGWPTPYVTMTYTTKEFGNDFFGGTKSESNTEYNLFTWSALSCPLALISVLLALIFFGVIDPSELNRKTRARPAEEDSAPLEVD